MSIESSLDAEVSIVNKKIRCEQYIQVVNHLIYVMKLGIMDLNGNGPVFIMPFKKLLEDHSGIFGDGDEFKKRFNVNYLCDELGLKIKIVERVNET